MWHLHSTKVADASASDFLPKDADPDLHGQKDHASPVLRGNKCTVKKQYLDKLPIDLHFTAAGMGEDDVYYEVAFTNTSLDNVKGILFIARESLPDFRALAKEDGELYMFEVTSAFQYGQLDKHGRSRFLVFQDPELIQISQHRFMVATWLKFGNMACEQVGKLPQGANRAKAVGIAIETLSRRFGEQLKHF